eukprot:gene3809-4336_t
MPEAKCHIKEAVMICTNFSLPQRQLEFLLEEAEIHLISHAKEKLEEVIKSMEFLLGLTEKQGDRLIELPDACQHESDCTCEACCNIFQMKSFIRFLILKAQCNRLTDNHWLDDDSCTPSLIDRLFGCVAAKTCMTVSRLQDVIVMVNKRKEKKCVKFIDETGDCYDKSNFGEVKKELPLLNAEEMTHLIYLEENVKLNCLIWNTKDMTDDDIKVAMGRIRDETNNAKYGSIILHNYRRAIGQLFYENALLLLESNHGIREIKSKWNALNYLINVEKNTEDDAMKKNDKDNEMRETRSKRAVSSKRGKGRKTRSKKTKEFASNKEDSSIITSDKSDKVCILDEVEKLCCDALAFLVPCLDCLLIKKIYNLLSLISGYKDVEKTSYLEHLSFATVLKEQMFLRSIKDQRKSSSPLKELPNILNISCNPFFFQNCSQLNEIPNSLPKADKKPLLISIPLSNDDNGDDDDSLEDSTMNDLVRSLSSAFQSNPIEQLEDLLEECLQTLQTENVESWWQNRKCLDEKIQKMINRAENKWLNFWKGILLGQYQNCQDQNDLESIVNEFHDECKAMFNISLPKDYVELIFDSYSYVNLAQVKNAFQYLLGEAVDESIIELFLRKADQFEMESLQKKSTISGKARKSKRNPERTEENSSKRLPVILVLDKEIQKFPWENMSIIRGQIISRMPSAIFTQLSFMNSKNIVESGVNTRDAFYVLNPRNDLQNTQKTFEKWFSKKQGWDGTSGEMPSEEEYRNALTKYDMFVYCGHGNGQEFLRGDEIQRITCKAVTFLMGCSSGSLQVKGDLEARGMALNYIMAGCPAIVANLWDVTDKDIDRRNGLFEQQDGKFRGSFNDALLKMVVLKNIPRVLSPELLSVLARMGHGDEIVLADANFPSASVCKEGPELVRADGHGIPSLLKAVLHLFPLDTYVESPIALMDPVPSDKAKGLKTPIWDEYKRLVNEAEGQTINVELVDRFSFYTRAKTCFAVVATGEGALYGNIILKKGALPPEE